jgi:ribosomal protein S8
MSCGWNTNQGLNIAIVVTTIGVMHIMQVSNEDLGGPLGNL